MEKKKEIEIVTVEKAVSTGSIISSEFSLSNSWLFSLCLDSLSGRFYPMQ